MSCNWPSVRLGELTDITSSKRIKRADYVTSGVPFFRSKEVIERSKGNDISTELFISEEQFSVIRDKFGAPEAGDILLTSVGTLGVPYQVRSTDRFYFKDGNLTWLRKFKESVLPEYVLYWLRSPVAQRKLDEVSIGSTQRALTIVALKSVEIPLPPKGVQARIVDMAMSLDQKLETNRNINQTLEQMAQAIFKSWFVDFEPVKAKIATLEAGGSEEDALLAAMQAISGKGETELTRLQAEQPEQYAELRATAELFPSAMQDSELGEIPEGWSVSPISDFGKIVCGKTPSKQKSEFYGGHIPFIKIPDMHGNMFATTTSDHLSPEGAASQPKKAIPKGSICVSCIATVGQVVIASEESHTNQQINSIIPFEDNYTAYLYFRMESLYEYLHDLASGGSATLNLNTGSFSRIQILMPSNAILADYAKSCAALLDCIFCNMKEIQSLSTLRDTLLPKLLTGELSISGSDDHVADEAEPADV